PSEPTEIHLLKSSEQCGDVRRVHGTFAALVTGEFADVERDPQIEYGAQSLDPVLGGSTPRLDRPNRVCERIRREHALRAFGKLFDIGAPVGSIESEGYADASVSQSGNHVLEARDPVFDFVEI